MKTMWKTYVFILLNLYVKKKRYQSIGYSLTKGWNSLKTVDKWRVAALDIIINRQITRRVQQEGEFSVKEMIIVKSQTWKVIQKFP